MKFRKLFILSIITIFVVSCKKEVKETQVVNYKAAVKKLLLQHQAFFTQKTVALDSIAKYHFNDHELKKAFLEARLAYKKVEPILAHFYPDNTKRLNGAAIPYNDIYDNTYRVIEPSGFQVIEELLFDTSIDTIDIRKEIYRLKILTTALENKLTFIDYNNTSLFEGFRLEVLRIISLGLSGFDSPIAFYSLPEAISALEGLKSYIEIYSVDHDEKLDLAFEKAIKFIKNSENFNSFDRYTFIKNFERPLSKIILDIQKSLAIPFSSLTTVVDFEKESFSDENVFNKLHFAPPNTILADSSQIHLGKQLFFDPILSGNGKVSCATCHVPELAYADRKRKVLNATNLET